MTLNEEKAYEAGNRAAWVSLLKVCLKELGYETPPEEIKAAKWVAEREEAIAVLKRLCQEHGDLEWDENLHLADVIDKHLGRHLQRDEDVSNG